MAMGVALDVALMSTGQGLSARARLIPLACRRFSAKRWRAWSASGRTAGSYSSSLRRPLTGAEAGSRSRCYGLKETEAGVTMKLKRGTFSATFFLACLAAMELEGVVLEEI